MRLILLVLAPYRFSSQNKQTHPVLEGSEFGTEVGKGRVGHTQ